MRWCLASVAALVSLAGCPAEPASPDAAASSPDGAAAPNDVFWVDADIGASWSPVTDEVVWHDLATDGRRLYAAGYASEVLMGGVLRRTIVIAAYELDGSLAWRHELGAGTNTGEARAVEVDPTDGTIWFGGQLERDVALGAASLTEIGGSDAFLLAVSPAGDGMRGWVFGGEGHDAVDALALGTEGPIVAGQTEGAVDLGGGPVMAGDRDQSIFVASFTRSGAHRRSTLYTLTDGDGIEVEDLDVAPGDRVVLIGHLNEVVEVSFGGPPLTNVDGSFVLELDPDGSHVRSWAAPARARLGGVVALDDSAILFGSFQGRMMLGGEERVSFGTALSERCIATPTDPECALLDGGAWVGWSDSFLVRMRDPETVDWFVQHHGTTPGGTAYDLEPDSDGGVVLTTDAGHIDIGGSAREATAVRALLDGSLSGLGSSPVDASQVVPHPGGVVVSDTTGEQGGTGTRGSSTLTFLPLAP